MAFRTNKMPVLQTKSASGSVATFNTALAMPLASCNIAVNAWQEGSGDPSPVNVRNIVPMREVNIYQRGINLWDEQTRVGTYVPATGVYSPNQTDRLCTTNPISVLPNTTYYFKSSSGLTVGSVYFYAKNGDYLDYITGRGNNTFTTPADCYKINCSFGVAYGTTYNHDISINYPSTDTDYHAYTGNIYTIQFGEEVYGAEVDVVNGGAHVTHRYIDFNNVEFITYSSGTLGIYYCSTGGGAVGYNGNNLCSCFKKSSANNVGSMDDLSFVVREGAIYLRNSNYVNDLSGFTDSVKNNSMIIELSTHITIPLTPTEIKTLNGNNTIFADTGDIDLTYKDLDIAKRGNFREVFKLPS